MRKLILFGAGHYGRDALSFFGAENVFCFCDNKIEGLKQSFVWKYADSWKMHG